MELTPSQHQEEKLVQNCHDNVLHYCTFVNMLLLLLISLYFYILFYYFAVFWVVFPNNYAHV